MGTPRKLLKNDPDRRMSAMVEMTAVGMPERELQQLDRANLDQWIAGLRHGERKVRHLRKRLEALRDQSHRTCPVCGRPVTGRPDAVYCDSSCRVRAHRRARKQA